jgi:hypothetical protein
MIQSLRFNNNNFMQLYVGIAGSILCIVALAITLFKIGFGDSIEYKLLNLFGGVCLLYYAVIEQVIPFIILEATWVLLPLITLLSSKFRAKKPAESPN